MCSSVEKVWPITGAVVWLERDVSRGKAYMEGSDDRGEGQKQGQLNGESAKQEENGERVDFI